MERTHLDFEGYFEVVMGTDEAQAAEMTVEPGRSVGGPENYHPESDQWLFVVSGTGGATVDGDEQRIDAGERHGIANDGDEPLKTVNFYTPPR